MRQDAAGRSAASCRPPKECLTAGTLAGADAEELARTCWGLTPGLSSLEVSGMLTVEDRDAFAEVVLAAPLAAHRVEDLGRPADVT